jgi:hypothetical protein
MALLAMGSLINSGTFSQANTSPKQIIVQNILYNDGFHIHFMTEKHKISSNENNGDYKTSSK